MVVLLALGMAGAPASAAEPLTVYKLPKTLNYAEVIAAGPDGAMWFTQDAVLGPRTQLVLGRITTAGAISSIALPRDARPISLAIGPDHALWYASWSPATSARLGRIVGNVVTELPIPGLDLASAVLTGPDGALWFAADDRIGRVAADGTIATYVTPDAEDTENIVNGPDGAMWFATALRIGRIDTSGRVRYFRLPIELSPEDIVAGPDGALWFTGDLCDCIGRMTTAGAARIFRLAELPTSPGRIAVGADDALWFTHSLGVGRITTTGEITDFELQEPRDSSRFAEDLAVGPDGAMWLTLQDSDIESHDIKPRSSAIGRIDVGGANARLLLLARLDGKALKGRAGRFMRVRFTSTRYAAGSLKIVGQKPGVLDWRTYTQARIPAGATSVRVRLPRRPGTYRALLRLHIPYQGASDSALVRVSK